MRIFCVAAAIVFGLTTAASANPCAPAWRHWFLGDARLTTDTRALGIYRDVAAKAGKHAERHTILCDFLAGPNLVMTPTIDRWSTVNGETWYIILLPRVEMQFFSNDGLAGVLGHEFGHELRDFGELVTADEEGDADAIGAGLVGPARIMRSFAEYGRIRSTAALTSWEKHRIELQVQERTSAFMARR